MDNGQLTTKCAAARLKLLTLLVGVSVGLFFTATGRMQTTAPNSASVTAGQKFKNIKVLTNMPGDQLGKVMNIMSASLGVSCSYCHVGYDFEKDGNPKKEIARRMLRMTFELNRENFSGRTVISCNTCHRGSPEPVARPNLDAPAESATPPKPDTFKLGPASIIERYELALGTPAARARIRTRHMVAERIEPDGSKEPEEVWQQLPDKMTVKTTYPSDYVIFEGFDGRTAWKTSNGSKIDLKADEIEQIRQNALVGSQALSLIYPNLDFGYRSFINGRAVNVLVAEGANSVRDELSFDAATGLLLRRESSTRTVLGDYIYRVDFSDYREFDGVKMPMTVQFAMPDVSWTRRISQVSNNQMMGDIYSLPPQSRQHN